jgi:hypothetical protein
VDVYKFRDAVVDDDATVAVVAEAQSTPRMTAFFKLDARRVGIISCVVVVAFLALFLVRRPVTRATSAGQVIPVLAAPRQVAPNPDDVSITDFRAVPTDTGTVEVSFHLANRNGSPNDYPALLVHWQGVPNEHRLIRRDVYAHPPLPFTNTDVELELAPPKGATGIDVKIAY